MSPDDTAGLDLMSMRAVVLRRADITASADYLRDHAIDPATVAAFAGALGICRCRFLACRRFEFAEAEGEGELAAVIEVYDSDDETVVDLCAWPVDRPEAYATAFGFAAMLGAARINNPATYFAQRPLTAWRTPLAWLRAGAQGLCILDPRAAAPWLADALSRGDGRRSIAGEDVEHARQLARLLTPLHPPERILAPLPRAA